MRILHTSDWHLGQAWNGRSRKREFQAFLDWLLNELETRNVDVLIVAGDIFDTSTPSPDAQSMYFDFLTRVAAQRRQTVIVAGNHDSPSLLDAPKGLLRALHVHVIGVAAEPEKELVLIRDGERPKLIVAAVPFLRDRDIRRAVEGASLAETDNRTVAGIRLHYQNVCRAAEGLREQCREQYPEQDIPLVVTGHLFTSGIESTGEIREIHVGTLGQLGSDIFPDGIDYLALGHIHRPCRVAGKEFFRYSGSPIPMSFGEADHEKVVVQVDFDGRTPNIETISVPRFCNIRRMEGDLETILKQLHELQSDAETDRDSFVEVIYTGLEPVHDLVKQVEAAVTQENIEIIRIHNGRETATPKIRAEIDGEKLEDMKPIDVFERLLKEHEKTGTEYEPSLRGDLLQAYREILEQCEQMT